MKILVLFCAFAFCATSAEKKTFQNYQVLRTGSVEDQETLATLLKFDGLDEIQFWKYPSINQSADIMVSPRTKNEVAAILTELKLPFNTMVQNVETLIAQEYPDNSTFEGNQYNQMSWTRYHRYDVIKNYAKSQGLRDSMVTYQSIGTSTEGREIPMVKISTGGANNKPAIWMDGGMHAREWISPATVTYMMNKLITDNKYRDLVEKFDWYIVPVVNVDGYEFTHTNNRLWRKTRSVNQRRPSCRGVDPNRNFGYHWGESGSSGDPCSDIYRGSRPFSEPETAAVARQLKSLKNNLKAYFTFHSYSQMWLVPWGYSKYQKPVDYRQLLAMGRHGATALRQKYGTSYRVGTAPDLLYPAAGGSDDYAKGSVGIKYAYTLELRDNGRYGFTLPAGQIIPTGEETLQGIAAFARKLHEKL